jgi:hypothetical protein
MKQLYEAADRIEAQMLKDFLAGRHIETVITGDYLAGGAGELSALQFPLLWVVEDRDLEIASMWLQEFLNVRESSAVQKIDWQCGHCGELIEGQFDLCWRCGTPRE